MWNSTHDLGRNDLNKRFCGCVFLRWFLLSFHNIAGKEYTHKHGETHPHCVATTPSFEQDDRSFPDTTW